MNAIRCLNCGDIIVPIVNLEKPFVRKCYCETVEIMAIGKNIVEVKLKEYTIGEGTEVFVAEVVKINNMFLKRKLDYGEFPHIGDLFTKNRSHIVLAELDTPGVKVVEEFSEAIK